MMGGSLPVFSAIWKIPVSCAEESGVKSIAFCCISTDVFMFPNQRAAEIAVGTVQKTVKHIRNQGSFRTSEQRYFQNPEGVCCQAVFISSGMNLYSSPASSFGLIGLSLLSQSAT